MARDTFQTFGELLAYLRKRARLTQEELARAVGYSREQIVRLEKNQRAPDRVVVATGFIPALALDGVPELAQRLLELAGRTRPSRTNLPAQLTSFIGREADVAKVRGYLLASDKRLVTLIGPPGIGKTRLSLEVAHEVIHDFPDGVFFVALAAITDPDFVSHALAQTLGLVEADQRSTLERLTDGIDARQMLIVLDNFEQIIEVAPLTADLLRACPNLKLVVTSRESLRVPGEWLYPVPPLSVPADAQLRSLAVGALDQFSALILFAERAQAVQSNFVLTPENAQPVAAICRQLDGLPLAIELIAARIRWMPPQVLLSRLTSDFTLHADGMRGVPDRQKTLHNAIAWSYALLSLEGQRLFAALSVFSGGFTLEAAQAITQIPNVIAGLASQLDKSLLVRTLNAHDEARFNQLVMIRDFALDRLREYGEEAATRDRHAAYFLAVAEEADRAIHGPRQTVWLNSLEVEKNNLLAALAWLFDRDASHLDEGLRLAGALGEFWRIGGYWIEGLHWLERALAKTGDQSGSLRAKLLLAIGPILIRRGQIEQAVSYLRESLALHEQSSEQRGMAQAMEWLGVAAETQGNLQQGIALYEQSLALFQSANDKPGIASLLIRLGYIAQRENDRERATSLLEESLTISQAAGDKSSSASALRYLGWIAFARTNLAQAAKLFRSSLTLARELNAKNAIASVLIDLGELARVRDDYAEAAKCYEESLLISQDLGAKSMTRILLHNLGHVALHQQDTWRARLLFEKALTKYRTAENEDGIMALCFRGLGAVASTSGEFERAVQLFGVAEVLLGAEEMAPADLLEYDRHLTVVRDQVEASTLESLLAEGRALTLEQAIDLALQATN